MFRQLYKCCEQDASLAAQTGLLREFRPQPEQLSNEKGDVLLNKSFQRRFSFDDTSQI